MVLEVTVDVHYDIRKITIKAFSMNKSEKYKLNSLSACEEELDMREKFRRCGYIWPKCFECMLSEYLIQISFAMPESQLHSGQ